MILVLMTLINTGCLTKTEYVILESKCPILKSIDAEKVSILHQQDPDTIERYHTNMKMLMGSLGCKYNDPDMWED